MTVKIELIESSTATICDIPATSLKYNDNVNLCVNLFHKVYSQNIRTKIACMSAYIFISLKSENIRSTSVFTNMTVDMLYTGVGTVRLITAYFIKL